MNRFLLDFSRNFAALWRRFPSNLVSRRKTILFAYLRLALKLVFFDRLLKIKIRHETIFGFHLKFFNYLQFVRLFEEGYVRNEYYFQIKNDQPTVIDCGANLDTVFYFKWLYPRAKIIAFEADPRTFNLLRKNVIKNGLSDVTLHNFALSDHVGTVKFYTDLQDPGSGINSLYKRTFVDRRTIKEVVSVPARKLSEFIVGPVDFLKMDIEGAEDTVLGELHQAKKLKLIREMVVEYHHHHGNRPDNLSKILGYLEADGFSYQLSTLLKPPFEKGKFQDILIYALAPPKSKILRNP